MSNIIELHTKCNYCKREILDGMMFYTHPKYGVVCERCEPFSDGGVCLEDEAEDNE